MASVVLDYFQKHGLRLVEDALQGAAGKPRVAVTDDEQYRACVIQPGWNALPQPIRMLKRTDLRWDEFFLVLRGEVFDLSGAFVALRPNAMDRVVDVALKFFRPAGEAKKPAPPAPPAAPPAGPPLAMPVGKPVPGPAATVGRPATGPAAPAPAARDQEKGSPAATPVAVGIDLGTTYSLIAHVDATGRPVSILNGAGDRLTPSVVLFEEGGTVVGKEAVLASAMEPDRVAECVKRDMGAKVYRKKVNGELLPPEVISSFILRSLKGDAERELGRAVRRAVITVPAYFEETRRRATMDAGRLAGLEVLDILNEPTAAAIAYGYNLGFLDQSCGLAGDKPLRVLVYDLGGGTFDVTIVQIEGRHFKALATDGDVSLGGRDWDEKLIEIAAERFRQLYREDPRENPASLQELWLSAEAAKRTLTERRKAAIFVNHLGSRMKVEVTREEFEEATAALLERTRLTTEIVARQAGLTWDAIDRVLVVGGSTRMPMVVRMLEELSGKPVDRSISVDEAVAHGAALYAGMLSRQKGGETSPADFELTNVNSHSLGILGSDPRTGEKVNKILLPKNTPLPRTVTKTFRTYRTNQRSVAIKVLEGESDRPEACSQVGVCAIRDLPADLPKGWPVQVSYTYEANGRLHVSAKLQGHEAGVTTDFTRENSLPAEELDLWTQCIEEDAEEEP